MSQTTTTKQAPKSATKAAATKRTESAATKANREATTKAVGGIYRNALIDALGGKYGQNVQRFYSNAIAYHRKQATAFPRARLAAVELIDAKALPVFMAKHATAGIPAGSHTAQKLFDAMVGETFKGGKVI